MAQQITKSIQSSSLADILERVLDKGVVIAGDIKVKLVDIELLTIQIRLVVCSVEKAMEMGMDWWVTDPNLCSMARNSGPKELNGNNTSGSCSLGDEDGGGARRAPLQETRKTW